MYEYQEPGTIKRKILHTFHRDKEIMYSGKNKRNLIPNYTSCITKISEFHYISWVELNKIRHLRKKELDFFVFGKELYANIINV